MSGTGKPDNPCPECKGKGFIVLKDASGADQRYTCPVCRGSKHSDGIVRK